MKECLLAERSSLPAEHSGRRDRNPVHAAGLVGHIATDRLEDLAPKQLAPARNVILTLEAVRRAAVPLFLENGSGNAQLGIVGEFLHQKLQVLLVERQIGVEIPDYVVAERGHAL